MSLSSSLRRCVRNTKCYALVFKFSYLQIVQSKTISFSSISSVFGILFFLMVFVQSKAQTVNTTVFPLNEYLFTSNGNPYPLVNNDKLNAIDTSKFVNVMNYGAKGDGKTFDDIAIANAFKAAEYGVIFPSGKTFIVSKLSTIILTHDLTVYAYGATIKMAPFSRYSFLSLEYQYGSYHNTVIWLGGTFDGNKNNQSWPGSPTGNNIWEEQHGRLVGVNYAQFALFKGITLVNTVMDGIGLEENRIAVIADSKASGGAPLQYSQVQDQGTYFKCTRANSHAFYCMNLSCDGGSIGVHYSTPNYTASDSSITVVYNCNFNNQAQDAIHFEDCKRVFLYKNTIGRNVKGSYNADVHVSNTTEIASIKSCQFRNARLDFNNSSNLLLGIIDSCQFISEYRKSALSIQTFIVGRPTVCINSSFSGKTALKYQGALKNIRKCTFTNFDSVAISGGYAIDSCVFISGMKPASLSKGGFVLSSTFTSVQNSLYKSTPENDDWKKIYLSYIDIVSDTKEYLGRIDCGGNTEVASKIVTNSPASLKKSLSDNNMNALSAQKMLVYPNPTVDELHITLNEKISGKTMLNIYDQQGRPVQTKTIYKNTSVQSESFNVKNLTSGYYVLQIVNELEKSSFKFIVAK